MAGYELLWRNKVSITAVAATQLRREEYGSVHTGLLRRNIRWFITELLYHSSTWYPGFRPVLSSILCTYLRVKLKDSHAPVVSWKPVRRSRLSQPEITTNLCPQSRFSAPRRSSVYILHRQAVFFSYNFCDKISSSPRYFYSLSSNGNFSISSYNIFNYSDLENKFPFLSNNCYSTQVSRTSNA